LHGSSGILFLIEGDPALPRCQEAQAAPTASGLSSDVLCRYNRQMVICNGFHPALRSPIA
jgi:hypothetical protein